MLAPIESCPAAHSMDTTWFALDSEGYIGAFETGEDGALPMAAAAGPEGGDYDAWPLDALMIAQLQAEGELEDWREVERPVRAIHTVVVLADAERGEALDEEFFVVREAQPRILASWQPVSPARFVELRALPEVARVMCSDVASELCWDRNGPMFTFVNDDYGNPGNYVRAHGPQQAINARQLPAALRAPLAALTLPLRFAESERLHLADHIEDEEAHTWAETTLRGEPLAGAASAATDERGEHLRTLAIIGLILLGLALWAWAS